MAEPDQRLGALEVKTSVPARMQVKVSKFEHTQTTSGPHFNVVDAAASSGAGYRTQWNTALDGLDPGTKYHVVVWATDEKGGTAYRQGTFVTHDIRRWAVVHFNRIHVIGDGDHGKRNRGELELFFAVDDEYRSHLHQGTKKVKSGSGYGLPWDGGRPGTLGVVVDDAPRWLNLKVQGVERDFSLQFCSEGIPPYAGLATGSSDCLDFATAAEHLDLDGLFPGLAHLVEFETTNGHLKFRIEAEVVVSVEEV